jgi:hypothetical protein
MDARKDEDEIRVQPVPEDVREASHESTAGPAVSVGVSKRILADPHDRGIHRFAKLMTEAGPPSLVPVLDSHPVGSAARRMRTGRVKGAVAQAEL